MQTRDLLHVKLVKQYSAALKNVLVLRYLQNYYRWLCQTTELRMFLYAASFIEYGWLVKPTAENTKAQRKIVVLLVDSTLRVSYWLFLRLFVYRIAH